MLNTLFSILTPPEGNGAVAKLAEKVMGTMIKVIPTAYELFLLFLIISFLLGVVVFAAAIMLKNGPWQKWSITTMVVTFIFFMAAHLVPLILLTMSVTGVKLIVTGVLVTIKEIGMRLSVGLVLIGLAFNLYYKAEEHPGYLKRQKVLFLGAGFIFSLSYFVPKILEIL